MSRSCLLSVDATIFKNFNPRPSAIQDASHSSFSLPPFFPFTPKNHSQKHCNTTQLHSNSFRNHSEKLTMDTPTVTRRRANRPARSVTFQLPGILHPVTPRDPVIGPTRKRRYSPTQDGTYSESFSNSGSYFGSESGNVSYDGLDGQAAEQSTASSSSRFALHSSSPLQSSSPFQRSSIQPSPIFRPSWPRRSRPSPFSHPYARALGLDQPDPRPLNPFAPPQPRFRYTRLDRPRSALNTPIRSFRALRASRVGYGPSTQFPALVAQEG